MATLKVQDLPKEEQEKLMAEAQAVGIRGIVAGWGVETLKNKIAEEKAKLNGENEQKSEENKQKSEENEQKPEENEQKPEENKQKSEENEQKPEENEQKPEENEGEVIVAGDGGVHNVPEETPATDEQKAEETPDADENANVEETPEENKDEQPEEKEEKEIVRNGICHICRSEVINGKCTGCGFELRV